MSEPSSGITTIGTVGTFLRRGMCSETLLTVLNHAFDPATQAKGPTPEERASGPLSGGIIARGYQCGMVWGSTLAAGAEAYRRWGPGPETEARAVMAAQRIVESFRVCHRHINCAELTVPFTSELQTMTYFFLKGGVFRCFSRSARTAPVVHQAIIAALTEQSPHPPPAPTSCSALLARKMGASDLHTTMAAGLAGGIGLWGGGCGALGAALWIRWLQRLEAGAKKVAYGAPEDLELLERFLACTNKQFECSKILGQGFETLEAHAAHVRGGGCAEIIEVLAGALRQAPSRRGR